MGSSGVQGFKQAADEVASFFKSRIRDQVTVRVITDSDPDGISAGNIIVRCLHYYSVPFHLSFGGPQNSEKIKELKEQDYGLFVFLDQGTAQFPMIRKHLLESNKDVIIMDHHPGEVDHQPGLAHLNPHDFGLDGTRDVCASGVAYKVVERFGETFYPLSEMAIIGAIGDRQESSTGFTGINAEILEDAKERDFIVVREGLKLSGRTSTLLKSLTRSARPYLRGLTGNEESSRKLIEDVGLNPSSVLEELDFEEEEVLRDEILERVEIEPNSHFRSSLWGTIYTPRVRQAVGPKNIHEFVAMLEACEKFDREKIGFSALLGDENFRDESLELLRKYEENMIDAMDWILSEEDRIKTTPRMRYLDAGDELEPSMVGEAISVAIESALIEVDRPVVGMSHSGEGELKVSARATSEYAEKGSDLGEVLEKVSKELGGLGGGHDLAAGARLPVERKDEFLRKLDLVLKEVES